MFGALYLTFMLVCGLVIYLSWRAERRRRARMTAAERELEDREIQMW